MGVQSLVNRMEVNGTSSRKEDGKPETRELVHVMCDVCVRVYTMFSKSTNATFLKSVCVRVRAETGLHRACFFRMSFATWNPYHVQPQNAPHVRPNSVVPLSGPA